MADIVPANAEVAIARSAETAKNFIGSAGVQEGIEAYFLYNGGGFYTWTLCFTVFVSFTEV